MRRQELTKEEATKYLHDLAGKFKDLKEKMLNYEC